VHFVVARAACSLRGTGECHAIFPACCHHGSLCLRHRIERRRRRRAPKAQRLDAATRALYVRAWHECYAEFSGYRGPAGSNVALPAIESCFKEKTGRYPFQLSRP